MANRWREIVREIPGVSSLTFTSSLFTAGEAVNIELAHRDFDTLLQITERIKDVLSNYQGVFDIADNFETGKAEFVPPENSVLLENVESLFCYLEGIF